MCQVPGEGAVVACMQVLYHQQRQPEIGRQCSQDYHQSFHATRGTSDNHTAVYVLAGHGSMLRFL
jgi:hypothetical protein